MDTLTWTLVPLGLALLAGIGWVAWKSEEYEQHRAMRFRDDLISAIVTSQPTWALVVDMAETERVPLSKVYLFCRRFIKDILTGSDGDNLKPHQALIESYIREHRSKEPFEGLPTEVRIHLERLSDSLGMNASALEPLTHQIRELVAMHSAENKKQRRYTSWGFFLGVLGVLFAAYAYFFPIAPQPSAHATTAPASSPSK